MPTMGDANAKACGDDIFGHRWMFDLVPDTETAFSAAFIGAT